MNSKGAKVAKKAQRKNVRKMDRDGAKRGGAEKGEGYAEENLIGFANFDLAFNLIKRLCFLSRRSKLGVRS